METKSKCCGKTAKKTASCNQETSKTAKDCKTGCQTEKAGK